MDLNGPNYRFIQICSISEVRPGERIYVELEEKNIVIFNIESQFYALEDACSHDKGPIGSGEVEGLEVICPRHGARFNIQNGKALSMPAVKDIVYYPVREREGKIEIGLPK